MKFFTSTSFFISYLFVGVFRDPFLLLVVGEEEEGHGNGAAGPCVPNNGTLSMRTMEVAANETLESIRGAEVKCEKGFANGLACKDVDLQSFVSTKDLTYGDNNDEANDIWGWTDPETNDEYAIVGLASGTAFVKISDPVEPRVVGFLENYGGRKSSWGDSKVYANHFFHVTESRGTYLQIFDLKELTALDGEEVVKLEATNDSYRQFQKAHNIVINEDSGYAYVVGSNTCQGGLHMIDIKAPLNPRYVGCYGDRGYTHDAQCVNYVGPDEKYQLKEICFAYNEDKVDIIDVSDKSNVQFISSYVYEGARYTHQGWLTEDSRYILINDETDSGKMTVFIAEVSDLENPRSAGKYVSPLSNIDHNLYVKDNFMYQAQYSAGVHIYNLDNISTAGLEEVAYFDTYAQNDDHVFEGAWSVYPFFPSGNIVVSSIGEGMYVLRPQIFDPPETSSGAPSSVPTDPPSYGNSASLVPTAAPSSEDTAAPSSVATHPSTATPHSTIPSGPTREYEAEPLSWNIDFIKANVDVDDDDDEILLVISYNHSDRNVDLKLFKDDCETEVDYQFDFIHYTEKVRYGFRTLTALLSIEQNKVEASPYWTAGVDGGSFRFCLSPRLHGIVNNEDTVVTTKNTIFEVDVTNLASFNIENIELIIPTIEENNDLFINSVGSASAYQCNSAGEAFAPVIEPGDVISVCIKADDENEFVASIIDLTLLHEPGVTFKAIVGGSIPGSANGLVIQDCDTFCIAQVQVIDAFFIEDSPGQLTVEGKVYLAANGNKKGEERYGLNEDGDPFSVQINLGKPCKTKGFMSAVKKGLRLN